MIWIAEHILWVLVAGWVISLLLFGRALFALWRWFHPRHSPVTRRRLSVVGSALMLVAGGIGLFIASSGLRAMGPGLIAQRQMLGHRAPELDYIRVADGAAVSLANHRGSVVLVNLWATWCPPCRQELPDLERLQKTYGARGLVVVHISDEATDTLSSYLAAHPMITEHGRADPLPWGDAGRPTTFLLDRDGMVRAVVLGARDFEQFETMIVPYL